LVFKTSLALLLSVNLLYSITLEYLNKQPKSIEKDFFIYLFLQQNPKKSEVKRVLKQVKRFNQKLKDSFKRYNLEPIKTTVTSNNNSKHTSATTNELYWFNKGIKALKQSNKKEALYNIIRARQRAKTQFKRDRANFWLYLISKQKRYLKKVAASHNANIYSLYACEQLGKKLKNIVTNLRFNNNKKPYLNHEDPFSWIKKRNAINRQLTKLKSDRTKINYLKKTLNTYQTLPHLAYMLDDYTNNNHFLFPYYIYISHYSKKRQALMLAITRQESRFIPTAVSTSFALGLMQFMPFLAEHTAKKLNIRGFKYIDMFRPKIAYQFANDHLNYLEKHLYHPLLVAYAYNGGIGFTRRDIIESKKYFKNSKYEPWLSMETIKPQEPMHYAKKVLANYIIYANLLGVNLTLSREIDKIKQLDKNYNF
jgi:soluble lytic murein transglycosylase